MPVGQHTVIDLLSSSDEENSDDEKGGGNFESSIRREHYSESTALQSPEHLARGADNYCPETRKDTKGSEDKVTTAAASDSSDDENDSVDHYELRSLEFLRNHCWACHLWIDHPGFETDENNDEICFNALHLHPILDIPVCVVCAETIEAVERNQSQERTISGNEEGQTSKGIITRTMEDDERKYKLTTCSACGTLQDDEGDFIRCDMCPRAVCPYCYQQARHSISDSEDQVLSFTEKHTRDMSIPNCICCSSLEIADTSGSNEDISENGNTQKKKGDEQSSHNLPPFLQELRRLTQELFSHLAREVKPNFDDALVELETLETERQQCELNLDDPKYLLETIREELLEEFIKEADEVDEDEIFEIHVQHRYQECYEKWTHHLTRVMDRIAILNDRIKAGYGIEAFAAFQYIETKNDASTGGNGDSDNGEELEPVWKVAADYELTKREKEERLRRKKEQRLAQMSGNNPKYLLEITEDTEELGSTDEDDKSSGDNSDKDEADAFDNGWRNAPLKARKVDIEAALRAEDKRRIEEGKMTLIRCNKNIDKEEIKEWDTGLKSSAMLVKKRAKKRKRLSTRCLSIPSGKGPSITTSASTSRDRHSTIFDVTLGNLDVNTLVGRPKSLKPSGFVLSKNPFICIAEGFDRHLKEHQREGIKFMYKSTFADLGNDNEAKTGGCVLAHSMGLGKFPQFFGIRIDTYKN